METLHAAISTIYAAAVESPLTSFKQDALRRLQRVVRFDSAVWGSGIFSTNTMLSITLLDQPVEMLHEYAARWQDSDVCRNAAVANPGTAFSNARLQPLDEYRASPVYRQFSKPWRIEDAMAIVQPSSELDLAEIVCLFRQDPDAVFTDADAQLLEQVAPHLAQAWGHAQIAHHYRTGGGHAPMAAGDARSYAVATPDGQVLAAGNIFLTSVRQSEPEWRGPTLPDPMLVLAAGPAETLHLGEFEFRRHATGDAVLISCRPGGAGLGLTAAELRAARLYADGLTQKDIAAGLGVSPSTIRNQLASAYGKLGCHTKVELLRRLQTASDIAI